MSQKLKLKLSTTFQLTILLFNEKLVNLSVIEDSHVNPLQREGVQTQLSLKLLVEDVCAISSGHSRSEFALSSKAGQFDLIHLWPCNLASELRYNLSARRESLHILKCHMHTDVVTTTKWAMHLHVSSRVHKEIGEHGTTKKYTPHWIRHCRKSQELRLHPDLTGPHRYSLRELSS